MPITVLVADDAEIMRRELRWFLTGVASIELVGEAADFADLVRMAHDLKPQIIVMDLHMRPDSPEGGYRALKSCLDCGSQLLAVSFSNDQEAEALADNLGAARLLDAMNLYSELIPSITQVASRSANV
jgi:DNA-binding NarL/FixJ family response regulator